MAKFILHGGYAGRPNQDNDRFFKEILRDTPENVNVLLVFFAKEKEEWKQKFNDTSSQFIKNKGDHTLSFEIAEEDSFVDQIKKADVVYFHGGNTEKLLNTLKRYPALKESFDDKVVAGESAGCYVLSTCFYSKSMGGVYAGLGFVPVKTICHYIGKNKEKLEECGQDLEFLLLADHKYKAF